VCATVSRERHFGRQREDTEIGAKGTVALCWIWPVWPSRDGVDVQMVWASSVNAAATRR
jgi:hypothetical protein